MKVKKHVKLYNRMWKALHAEDKFVVCNQRTHAENVDAMVLGMKRLKQECGVVVPSLRELAEVALEALQSVE